MKNYGYIPPKIQTDQYVFGGFMSLPKIIVKLNGQWDDSLPIYEPQADKYETWGCTVWGTENATEIFEKFISGGNPNYDERFIYNLVPIFPPGGDPHEAAERIRKFGLITNRSLPDTLDEFMSPRPPSDEDIAEGKKFLDKWEFGHEWVFTYGTDKKRRVELMKENLRYSPLGISVSAWHEEDGIYIDAGQPNNHWCVCYGYYEANGEIFWKVFDSYDHSLKILHPNYQIDVCKRYYLKLKEKRNIFELIIKWLKSFL